MTFLGVPLGVLGGAFAAVGAIVTSLYLLKTERRRVVVPFARLWLSAVGERRSDALWHRLKRVGSLLLQLAVLALLVLALGDPRPAPGADARSVVLVVDCSASMQTTDAKPYRTRLERAIHEARELVAGLGPSDQAAIVRLDARPVALGGLTSDARDLTQQLDGVTATDAPGDVEGALRLAGDLLRGRPHPTLILVGDGAWPREVLERVRLARDASTPSPPLGTIDLAGVDTRFIPVGGAADNVGITGFAVRRYRQNHTAYEVLLEVTSFRDAPSSVELELRQDDEVVDVERIDLAAGERAQRFLPNLSGAGTRLVARLTTLDGKPLGDALPLDDEAYAVLTPRPKQKVLLVTDGNLFLEGLLLLNENLAFDQEPPSAWGAQQAAAYDAIVFDGFTPDEAPRVPALYVDPRGPSSPFAIRGEEKGVFVTETADKHPLMRWVSLRDLNVQRTSHFALGPGDVALASSVHEPIFVAHDVPGEPRRVALGFDVRRSDLPLRVAFPVLLVNVFEWLAGDDGAASATGARTGRPSRVAVPGGEREATLQDPAGHVEHLQIVDGQVRFTPARVGFYTLLAATGNARAPSLRSVPANLCDAAESAIRPAGELTLDGRKLERPSGFTRGARRQLWSWLALAALVLSLVEWWTYHRRVTV